MQKEGTENFLLCRCASSRDFQLQCGLNFCPLLRLKRATQREVFTACNSRFLGQATAVHMVVVDHRYVTPLLVRGARLQEYIPATVRLSQERKWDSKCQLGGFIPRRAMRKLCKSELSSRIDSSSVDLVYDDTNSYKRSQTK